MLFSRGTLFRLFLAFLICCHVFLMYLLARSYIGGFGFRINLVLLASLFAFAMLIPLLWAVAFTELPEAWNMNVRNQRRWRRGCCPSCGYPRSDEQEHTAYKCQECGEALKPPANYQLSLKTVQRFVWILAIGWIVGVFIGETWVLIDEAAFKSEIQRRSGVSADVEQTRQRAWPGWGKLTYVQGEFDSR